jgi:phosphatidylserine decarboxylase
MPINYHCWHAPVTGYVVESRESVMGRFFGNPDFPDFFRNGNVGYDSEFSIFEVYHRGYYIFNTARYGYVAMIPVGLDDISSITFEPKFKNISEPKKVAVQKADIMGHFSYGGSMIILLFEKGVLPSDIKTSQDLLQGQRVAKLKRIDGC